MAVILIVEDEPLIAMNLGQMIESATGAEVVLAASVRAAEPHITCGLDFALLDVNLGRETSYDLARRLRAEGVPFAFASGSSSDAVPDDLKGAPFVAKPCRSAVIVNMVRAALTTSDQRKRSIARS